MRFRHILLEDASTFFAAFDAWAKGVRKTELVPGHWEYRMAHQWLVSLKIEGPDHIDITYIMSTVQGSGAGTKVLTALCRAADQAKVKLSLIADETNEPISWADDHESFEIPESRLQGWYARHGFEYTGMSNDYGPEMERLPTSLKESTDRPDKKQMLGDLVALNMNVTIFGSMARFEPKAADIDCFVDLTAEGNEWWRKAKLLLRLAQKYYGYIDAFVLANGTLMCLNQYGNDWQVAKNVRSLKAAIATEGKPAKLVYELWDFDW